MFTTYSSENLKEGDNLEDLGIDIEFYDNGSKINILERVDWILQAHDID
jgi:hypothetical protein